MSEPQAAATVMIARQHAAGIELFMLRRSSRSAFMPDVFVFPGGRVEPGDRSADALRRLAGTAAAAGAGAAHVYAAARETFEECGLLFSTAPVAAHELAAARTRLCGGTQSFADMLDELRVRIDAGALRYFSRWITPPGEARRFDTRFFAARAPRAQVALADAGETHDGIWIAPRDALTRYAAGSFALILPTIKHLERVSAFDSVDALLTYAASKPIHPVMPDLDGAHAFRIPPALENVW
jgi:8-oxo-dGTP pyrophosphatase MutT (NUDIX family)